MTGSSVLFEYLDLETPWNTTEETYIHMYDTVSI